MFSRCQVRGSVRVIVGARRLIYSAGYRPFHPDEVCLFMLTFRVQPDVFDEFPGMQIETVVATGIDNATPRPDIDQRWREIWAATPERMAGLGSAQSHHRVAPWRAQLTSIGVNRKKFPVAIESIVRRAMKGGDPFMISPFVNWYNSVSLDHVLPVGAFDADALLADGGELVLRHTREGDRFRVLGSDTAEPVDPGEVCYAVGDIVLTRHLAWRQSVEAMVTPETRNVIIISETLLPIERAEPGTASDMLAALTDGVREVFGAVTYSTILSADQPSASWDLPGDGALAGGEPA